MVAYLQIFWQKNAKFFQQCKFRSPEARNSMAIREYKQSSFFLQEKLQMSENCSTFAVAFGKVVVNHYPQLTTIAKGEKDVNHYQQLTTIFAGGYSAC